MADRMLEDPAQNDQLILVDGLDRQIGTASKLKAHQEGLLHRAFSVVLVRQKHGSTQVLLSQRALGKYHSGGLWANSCCSHPRAGEAVLDAAYRRVGEELGCLALDLQEIGAFAYREPFDNGLCEYEYDHVLIGRFEGKLNPDPTEVAALRWVDTAALAEELAQNPDAFAAWAYTVLTLALQHLGK